MLIFYSKYTVKLLNKKLLNREPNFGRHNSPQMCIYPHLSLVNKCAQGESQK